MQSANHDLKAAVGATPFSKPVNAFWSLDSNELQLTSIVEGKFLLDERDYRALEDFVTTGLALPASLEVFEATYPAPNLTIIAPDTSQSLHGEIGALFVKMNAHAGEYVKGFSGLSELGEDIAHFAEEVQSRYARLQVLLQKLDNAPAEQRANEEFRRAGNLVPLALLGQLAGQTESWRAKLVLLKDQFRDLKSETQTHKGTFTSITAALSTISQCIRTAIMDKQNEENEAHKNWGKIEEQRSQANRARNQVLIAGGLVAILGDPYVGLSIATRAATIQSEYEGYKTRRAEVVLTIEELKSAQMLLMREENVVEAIREPITQILGCVDDALSAIHKIEGIITNLVSSNQHHANALQSAIGYLEAGALAWVIDDLGVAYARWGEVARAAREFSRTEFLGLSRRLKLASA